MDIQDLIPKSRITLKYKRNITGEPEDIELPLRMLVLGDFSGKGNKSESFVDRKTINLNGKNTNDVLDQLDISISVPEDEEGIRKVNLPLKNVDDFLPGHIVKNIPEMDKLVNCAKTLASLSSSINNSRKFKSALMELSKDDELQAALKERLTPFKRELQYLGSDVQGGAGKIEQSESTEASPETEKPAASPKKPS